MKNRSAREEYSCEVVGMVSVYSTFKDGAIAETLTNADSPRERNFISAEIWRLEVEITPKTRSSRQELADDKYPSVPVV
jgi:hypothetical protein